MQRPEPAPGLCAARVSESELLEHLAGYAERTKNLEAQVNAWIDLFQDETGLSGDSASIARAREE